jgi:endonuclease/exonuclease/phosphatase (EEP) superfamily protein YafD
MTALEIVLAVLAAFVVVATALPVLRAHAWWIRACEFPRAQLAALAAAVLVAGLATAEPLGAAAIAQAALVAAALAAQLRRIRPYTRLARRQVQPAAQRNGDATLTLFVSNVLQHNREAARLLAEVERTDPDIVVLLEVDARWLDATATLRAERPHVVAHPLDNTYGIALYSRLPLEGPEVRFLVEGDVPSIHAIVRLRDGTAVELHCLHPRPPAPQENDRSTERDAELLLVAEAVRERGGPIVVAGDMNDVAWSRTTRQFQRISGLLDPRVGRGIYGTFPARLPFLRWPLDHIFHSRDFRLRELRILRNIGSDHLPVLVRLAHEPEAPAEQPRPERADAEEHREAAETIGKAGGRGDRS